MVKKFDFKGIAPCFLAVFVDILGFSVALPLLTAIFTASDFLPLSTAASTRFAYLAMGFILYPFFMFFGSSFMGDLSDRIGRKKVLLFCMAGFCIGFSLMGVSVQAKSILFLFIGRSLTGITAASLATTMAAIIDISTKENKASHMSFIVLIQGAGFVLGPLMAAFLSNSQFVPFFSDAIPLYTSGILALCAFTWIAISYKDSFKPHVSHKINPFRIFRVFVQVAKHPRIRTLTGGFLCHQIGIGLYMQLILIYLHINFHYEAFGMGLFNAFLGFWIGTGVVFIPSLSKRFRIEWVACVFIALIGIAELLTSVNSFELLVWVIAFIFGMSGSIAWSSILTSYSNAVDENSQGWAMGITGAVVALAFLITGFTPNLVPYFGVLPLLAVGGVILLIGSFILLYYCKKHLPEITH